MNNLQQLIMVALDTKGDMSGYDLCKLLKAKTNNSHQQVYRELAKLNDAGYVSYTDIPQSGKPDIKLYHSNAFAPTKVVILPTDFSKTNGMYSLAQADLVNGTDLCSEYLKEAKALEEKYLNKINP